MENQENKKDLTQGNDHPKPTDDVQLEIETVTPSTEKETDKPGEPPLKIEEVKDGEKLNDQDEAADPAEKPSEENTTENDSSSAENEEQE